MRAAVLTVLTSLAACAGGSDSIVGPGPGGGGNGNNGPGAPARLDVSTSAVNLASVGASENITATVRDANGTPINGAAVTWTSADITIADVAVVGTAAVITARAPGRTTVRAQAGAFAQDIAVNVLAIRTLTLAPTTATLRAGDQITFTTSLDADQGALVDLRWQSENTSVATVSAQGVLTALSPGSTIIRVNAVGDPRVGATAQVIVSPARSVLIVAPPATLWVGDQQHLTATLDVDSTETRAVTWSSDDLAIASVNAAGEVTAVGVGTTRIRVTSVADPRVRDSATLRVQPARTVTVSPVTASLGAGETRSFTAQVTIEAGLSTAVTWRSSNPSVAMVAANGMVTGVSQGTTTITAIAEADTTRRGMATVTIVPIVRDLDLTPAAASMFLGDTRQLVATVRADNGASTATLWRSSNSAIASVGADGVVTGVGVGTAMITALSVADTTKRATSIITVRYAPVVTVTPATVSLSLNETRQLTASVQADVGVNTGVTWRSLNPAVATVSASGLVSSASYGATTVVATSVADTSRSASATIIVAPAVQAVNLSSASVNLSPAESQTLTATVIGDAGVSNAVIWRTSSAAIATVSSTGTVTGVSIGTATVTAIAAADTMRRATASITVRAAPQVSVDPATVALTLNDQVSITATVVAGAGVSTAVTWRTLDPTIATVNAVGRVTAVGLGTTLVTAVSVADTMRRASTTVTVIPIVRGISVSPATATVAPGGSTPLTATLTGDQGAPAGIVWRTSAPAIATVSSTGVVSGVAIGTATITALAAGDTTKQATATITVANGVSISLTPSSASLALNEQRTFVAAVQAGSGVSQAVTWRTSAPSVATVSSGVVTGVGFGSATITAVSVADTTRQASATVTVVPQVQSVSVSPATAALATGQTVQLNATVTAQGTLSTAVTYRSSNPAVASVNFSGLVSAVGNGSATITVLANADTTKRATAAITVSAPATRLATSWSSARLGGDLYEDVVSLTVLDASNAFAVNSLGDVFRFAGSTWTVAARGSTYGTQFLAVSASSTSNVFAVGTGGRIIRFNGSSWSSVTSGTSATLNAVWAESGSLAFAVGANGTALQFNGSAWAATSTGSNQSLRGVWSTGGTAWAVGASGTILRFSGSTWTPDATPTSQQLNSVSGTSTTNVVAVGDFGTVLRFNGTSWSVISSGTTVDYYSVAGNEANGGRMHLASDGGLAQLNGSTVSTTSTPYTPRFFAAAVDGSGNPWTGGQRGTVLRSASGTWTTLNVAPDLIDAWTTSATNAWAVGEFGFVYRWNGSSWSRQSTPTTATLNTVWGTGTSEAFAGGDNGTMLRWNGSSWSTMSFPGTGNVYGLWGSSGSNVYAVTSAGQLVRYNGSAWSVVSTSGSALWSVHGSDADNVFAAGQSGQALRFNGSSWSAVNVPTDGTVAGVLAMGSGAIAVGANMAGTSGITFAFNGTSWSAQNPGSNRVLTSVWGPHTNDVYATGEEGTILHWNGSSWSAMSSGTADLLWSVTGAPSGTGGAFAVGFNSTVAAGTSSGGTMSSAMRFGTGGPSPSLEPAPGATRMRGALPSGPARWQRKGRR